MDREHEMRVEAIIQVLADESGGINTRDAFMALGEAAGLVLAFAPPEIHETYVTTLGTHVRGVAAMRSAHRKARAPFG